MERRSIWALLLGGLCGIAGWHCQPAVPKAPPPLSAAALDHFVVYFEGQDKECPAFVYRLQVDTADLQLLYGKGRPFAAIAEAYGTEYRMMMNAGMFHHTAWPVGLFISEVDTRRMELNTDSTSRGNFFLVPNGVFYVDSAGQAGIATTRAFEQQGLEQTPLRLATQSGPMLLLDGQYHPAFRESATSRYIRNGVGLRPDGTVVFICTAQAVNFHTFATLFLEEGCDNALYLDGAISGMYIEGVTHDLKSFEVGYGPVLGVVAPK